MTERTVLLIAFHFPPIVGSSGVQRTLRFSQHLSDLAGDRIVLSIVPSAYEASGFRGRQRDTGGVEVHRAFGMDAARHISIAGRYPRFLATPDRWATWRYWAVRKALRIIRERSVQALFSTFPIATAHRVGLDVASRTGLPWVAEFRDPMWQGDYPKDPHHQRSMAQAGGAGLCPRESSRRDYAECRGYLRPAVPRLFARCHRTDPEWLRRGDVPACGRVH